MHGVIEEQWRVVEAAGDPSEGRTVGFLARTRYALPQGELWRCLVSNAEFQEVGFIDELGRGFRLVPFESDPQLVTTGGLADVAARILRIPGSVRLVAIPTDPANAGPVREASARRDPDDPPR